ncbi:hypothetical protein IWW45_003158, partial [Coemansia sp. RSA 485]
MASDASAEPDQHVLAAAISTPSAQALPLSLPLPLDAVSGNHLTDAPMATASEADKSMPMHPKQDASQILQASMSCAASVAPNFTPLSEPSGDVGHDLARDIQMASLATPAAGATHFSINNQSSALTTMPATSASSQIQAQTVPSQEISYSSLPAASATSMASSLAADIQTLAHTNPQAQAHIQISPLQQQQQSQQHSHSQSQTQAQGQNQVQTQNGLVMFGISTDQMASAVLQSFGQLPATASATAALNAAAVVPAHSSAASAIVSSMQASQLPQNPQSAGISTAQLMNMANGHSRSASAVDGFISMFPADGSSAGTPVSGMAVAAASSGIAQPMAAHLKMQLQQHQQLQQLQQQQQAQAQAQAQSQLHAHSIQSGNISASGSANHSGVPSPLSYSSAATNAPALLGHRRQMSSTVPSAIHHSTHLSQPHSQQQQQMMFIDTPMSISTAPPTLVPGTPTTFGQLQFPMHHIAVPAVATPLQQTMHTQGLQNPHTGHHSHLGHSRHLSLDTANLRLMTADVSSLHETIHEHPAEHAHQAMQLDSANALALAQQLQFHSQIQQLQAQNKANPSPATHTVPVTPQHQSFGSFATGLQPAALSEPTLQQLQNFQRSVHQPPRQRQMFMHHSSCSVDLGTLSSAFNVAQFNQSLSGQISPIAINPASMAFNGAGSDVHPMHYSFGQNPQLMALSHAPTLTGSGATTEAVSADDFEDEDVDDDDDDEVDNSTDEKPAVASSASGSKSQGAKGGASKPGSASGSSTPKPKKVAAPYKRFRNSFIFFANERRKQWKREHPEVSKIQNRGFIQDMSKVWNNMTVDEKAPYIKMAEEDKVRYEADVKKFGPLPNNNTSSVAAGSVLATASAPSLTADAAASKGHKGKAASISSAGGISISDNTTAKMVPNVVPIAPAPMPPASVPVSVPASAPASVPVPVEATISAALSSATSAAVSISAAAAAVIAATSADVAASIAASVSVPASAAGVVAANSSTNVALGSNAALLVTPAQLSSDTAAAIAPPTPSAPSAIGSSAIVPMMPTSLDSMELDNAILAQHTYQVWLRQALGQDFSPQAIEFDPSCFVASDPTSADESNCYANTQSLTASADSMSQQLSVAPSEIVVSNAEASSKTQITSTASVSSSSGPLITTLVGTKRKSSSDGQPMTNLPISIKRFRNSFIYYVNEKRREIQFNGDGTPTNVEVNNREFLKEMSAKWRAMSEDEKSPYLRMADADKERFTKQMREYELEHPEEFVKAPRHKRRRSSTGASN